jgi:hypothetical protein
MEICGNAAVLQKPHASRDAEILAGGNFALNSIIAGHASENLAGAPMKIFAC